MGKALRPSNHSQKDVRKALSEIVAFKDGQHWRIEAGGHWGTLLCADGCCRIPVPGTPANGTAVAKRLLREARGCPRPPGSRHAATHPPDDLEG